MLTPSGSELHTRLLTHQRGQAGPDGDVKQFGDLS